MTDIVERLRDMTKCLHSDDDIRRVMMLHCNAAADEIERLREALGIVEAYLHVTANPSNELDIVRHALRNNN